MKLVIVESPAKSKTIEKYLGGDYKVTSSMGHIRDLATTGKYGLGVDIDDNFKPTYVPLDSKKKLIKDLKTLVEKADTVYLASDPDREGEAISWHLYDTLKIPDDKYQRVLFYEITKDKVLEGLSNPRKIDFNLVNSQETRRILDRIIGFRLSSLVNKETGGKSAGRVQSVALKLVVDREREIEAFIPEDYFTINAYFDEFDSELYQFDHKDLEIKTLDEANEIIDKLDHDNFVVEKVEAKSKDRASKLPFTTSTLQQEASTKLNFNAKKTMQIAQKLYEGIDLGNEHTGLITYMRTDSTRLSNEFTGPTFKFIEENYGKEYVGFVKQGKKKENVQDAHEGIRPTSILRTPESLNGKIDADSLKLYSLIYYRTLASLMASAKTMQTTVVLDNNNYQFKSTGTVITFDGYLKVYSKYEEANDTVLPELHEKDVLKANEIKEEKHTTKPKPRYTEAKLIKELEELGIGRPSTYATIMSIIRERGYVKEEDKKFVPQEIGFKVTDKLQEHFSNIINVEYTANMESDLDKIADGVLEKVKVLNDFYQIFDSTLKNATKAQGTGELCPKCGHELVVRHSKSGDFTACSNFPECVYVKQEHKELERIGEKCPVCNGELVKRHGKFGEFISCENYPDCKYVKREKVEVNEELGVCPNCGNALVEKKGKYGSFVACSNYPVCKYIKGQEDKKEEVVIMDCPHCKTGKIVEKITRSKKTFYGCNNFPKCKVALWDKPTGKLCPKCNDFMVEKDGKIVCNKCNYQDM